MLILGDFGNSIGGKGMVMNKCERVLYDLIFD